MTSEKRGTSAEYGQEKLRERAAQNAGDENPSVKMRISKKPCVSWLPVSLRQAR